MRPVDMTAARGIASRGSADGGVVSPLPTSELPLRSCDHPRRVRCGGQLSAATETLVGSGVGTPQKPRDHRSETKCRQHIDSTTF